MGTIDQPDQVKFSFKLKMTKGLCQYPKQHCAGTRGIKYNTSFDLRHFDLR